MDCRNDPHPHRYLQGAHGMVAASRFADGKEVWAATYFYNRASRGTVAEIRCGDFMGHCRAPQDGRCVVIVHESNFIERAGAKRGLSGEATEPTPRERPGEPERTARRAKVGHRSVPIPPKWRRHDQLARCHLSNRRASRSGSGRSLAFSGRMILLPSSSCKPCRSMGPSRSSRTLLLICTA